MIEEQAGCTVQQLRRVCSLARHRAPGIQQLAYRGRGFARRHRPLRKRVKEIGDAVHEPVPGGTKVV